MRAAQAHDVPRLVEFMASFYAESDFVLDRERAAAAFTALLADPRLGRVWIMQHEAVDVGYVVVTFAFGMEYGGLIAVVDDFYVEPAFRNKGIGTAGVAEVRRVCSREGIRGMSVEVGGENAAAQAVYRHAGFVHLDRALMGLRLAAPTHVEEA